MQNKARLAPETTVRPARVTLPRLTRTKALLVLRRPSAEPGSDPEPTAMRAATRSRSSRDPTGA